MKVMKLKPVVVKALYVVSIAIFAVSIFFIQKSLSDLAGSKEKQPETDYVDQSVDFKDDVPVVVPEETTEVAVIRPYIAEHVTVGKGYYDYKAEEAAQQNSIVYFEDTYLQNSGVDYKGQATFDVVAILDGTVTKVKEDKNLGKIIEIKHSNEMISVYQSLSEVTVKENDTVTQGHIIGKSGTSNVGKDLGDHLHFELLYKGMVVNPEDYYDKKVKEL